MPQLMGVNEANGEPVRRTARLADLPAAVRGLIDRLVDRHLLVVDRRVHESSAEETVIEVAHEALLRRWPTLRRWHDEARAALETQQETARAAAAWSQNERGADWLAHRGARLAEAEEVARREGFSAVFAGVPRAYLDACHQAEDSARDAEARRLARQRAMQRRVSVLLMVWLAVTLAGGWQVLAGRRELARQTSRLIVANAKEAFEAGHYDRAMRLALVASRGAWLGPSSVDASILLGRAAQFSRLEAQFTGQAGRFITAAFSPDGTCVVTSVGRVARVWRRGEEGAWTSDALEGHQGSILSAAFSKDGTHIVTASWDKTARVWSQDQNGAWARAWIEAVQHLAAEMGRELAGAAE